MILIGDETLKQFFFVKSKLYINFQISIARIFDHLFVLLPAYTYHS